MRAARTAALRALSTPTHATGTPGGIWAIESSASRPPATDLDDVSGTPITGSVVCAATTPGSAADRPAPAMITRSPRSWAFFAYSATTSGSRWADITRTSCKMSRRAGAARARHLARGARDVALAQLLRGGLHRRHVALGAHHDADARRVDRDPLELLLRVRLGERLGRPLRGLRVAALLLVHCAMS